MFCSQCGQSLPVQSKFCFKCGVLLEAVAQIDKPGYVSSIAPDTVGRHPATFESSSKAGGFAVGQAELEERYAAMSDDDLTKLRRSDLTEIANECVDREAHRRGIARAGLEPNDVVTRVLSHDLIEEYNSRSLWVGGLGIALIGVGVMAPDVYAGLSELIGSLMLFFGLAYYAKAKGRSAALCLWGFASVVGWIVLACYKTRPHFACSYCGGLLTPESKRCPGCAKSVID